VAGLRRFSHSLRPKLLDRFGLIAALDSLIAELKSEGNIRCCKKMVGKVRRISPQVELILFRIAQESLRNIKKHSKATEATLTIHFTDEMVNFSVRDNGIGFEIPKTLTDFARKQKLGLIGMQERAQLFGGNFKIVSKRGKGTTVTAEIPIIVASNHINSRA
jgi:signal transduction histidine kinase